MDLAVLIELRLQEFVQIQEVRRDGDEGADEDAEICKTFGTEVEVVDFDEDDHEGLEPDVQEAIDERDVEVEEEDHGLGEVEGEGPNEGHHDNGSWCHLLGHELWLTNKLVVSSDLAQTLGTADEDVVGTGLGEKEEEEDEAEGADPHQLPDGPSPGRGEPAFNWSRQNSEATTKRRFQVSIMFQTSIRIDPSFVHLPDEGPESRSADGRDSPNTHCIRPFGWCVHIAEGRATCSQDG